MGNLAGSKGVSIKEGTLISNSPFLLVLLGIFKTFVTTTPFIGAEVSESTICPFIGTNSIDSGIGG